MLSRPLVAAGILLIAAGAVRCSSVDASGSPSPGADAGSGSGGIDAGTGGGSGADAGTPADGGTGSGGGGGGGSGGGGGGSGGGTSACQGLMPAAPPGTPRLTNFNFGQGTGDSCIAGRSDGNGNFVVGSQRATGGVTQLAFYDANGSSLGSGHTSGGGFSDFDIFGQADGYIGDGFAGTAFPYVEALDRAGASRRPATVFSLRWGTGTEDPLGGLVEWVADSQSSNASAGQIVAFDTVGTQRWSAPVIGSGPFATLGVDRAGNILVLFQHGSDASTYDGYWFTHDGAPQGGAFSAYHAPAALDPLTLRLVPRIGNGFFLQVEPLNALLPPPKQASWVASIEPFATHSDPAPDWLASRPNTVLHPVRGGTGYGLMPVTDQQVSTCQQSIEVFAPGGESCGTVTFKVDDNACTTKPISIGWDGTVFQVLPAERSTCTPPQNHCDCNWRSWPGYFR